ncbi:DUF6188 family protein [Catelliglobosispora koreensis]|uniref:DUF6188 family protein n=1 Tax=Catelliglobosispora koreensis TaxID=129052 RepID=UPI00047595C8
MPCARNRCLALGHQVEITWDGKVKHPLHLMFHDSAEVFVTPDPTFESWHLAGHGVECITVGPRSETSWNRQPAQ